MDKPSLTVESTPRISQSPSDDATIVLGVINFHGRVIPGLDLQRRFGLPTCNYGLSATLFVARTKRRTLALPVAEVFGVQEVAAEIVSSHAAQLVSSALSNKWKPSACGRPR